jgi:hypothetical protein
MRRREFISLLSSAAAWPFAARAQRPAMPVVGFIRDGSADGSARFVAAFRKGLNETGYVEGQNVTVEYHWLEGLSLPKIISANNDCVVRRGLGWRGGFHIVVSVAPAAHPYPIQDACAPHCNTPNTRSGSAADAVRQRSERDPNSRAVASRSDVQRTGSATATSGRSGGHESPSFSLDS